MAKLIKKDAMWTVIYVIVGVALWELFLRERVMAYRTGSGA